MMSVVAAPGPARGDLKFCLPYTPTGLWSEIKKEWAAVSTLLAPLKNILPPLRRTKMMLAPPLKFQILKNNQNKSLRFERLNFLSFVTLNLKSLRLILVFFKCLELETTECQ